MEDVVVERKAVRDTVRAEEPAGTLAIEPEAAPEPVVAAEPTEPPPSTRRELRFEDEYVRPQLDLFLGEAPPVWAERPPTAPTPAATEPTPSLPEPREEPAAADPSLAVFVDETFVLLDEEVGGLAFPEVELE